MAGGVSFTAFGSPEAEPNQDILVVVFLRGGMDGLSLVMPIAGPDRAQYEAKRPDIGVAVGSGGALALDGLFGLHPSATHLHELFQSKHLAIVHAAGLTSDTRSHFDAMQFMELGTPGQKTATTGWLTRHLQSAGNLPTEIITPAIAVGNLQPASLDGSRESIGMSSPNDFQLYGHWYYGNWQRQALRQMYHGDGWLHQAGIQTLDAVDVIEWSDPGNYQPANGATYPNSDFGNDLQTVAQMIKMQLGLRVATVDMGGWDTHEYQGSAGAGYLSGRFTDLSQGLAAFFADLHGAGADDYTKRVTVTVMSEFGRSFQQNGSYGTDHGHGNIMFVMGGSVNGGKVYGAWPGLHQDQLYDNRDLEITTDYRRVLSEILIRRLANPNLGTVFPGYTGYAPLGILQGADLTPVYTVIQPTPTTTPNATPTVTPGVTPVVTPPANGEKVYVPSLLR